MIPKTFIKFSNGVTRTKWQKIKKIIFLLGRYIYYVEYGETFKEQYHFVQNLKKLLLSFQINHFKIGKGYSPFDHHERSWNLHKW